MKKSFFRLDTLLKMRKAHVSHIQRELAYSKQKFNQWEEKKRTLEQQITSLIDEMRQKRREKNHGFQETYAQILEHLNLSFEQAKHTLAAQEKQIQMQQERLKQAIQQRKLVEKIKEKHYAQWRVQTHQNEEALLDEVATSHTDPHFPGGA
ncbi:MAG: flagellar export protein FliJ [Chlamydiales bacterium]